MGMEIITQNIKVAKAERRFFPSIDEITNVDDNDDDVRLSLERLYNDHEFSFFNKGLRQSFDEDRQHDFEDHLKHAADEKRRIYWESQELLLQEILDQYHSTCSKIREQVRRNIDITKDSSFCNCLDITSKDCYKCFRVAAVDQLRSKGFNAFLRTSKWRRAHNTLGGKHEYIEVIATTQGRRKQIVFLVELEFMEEFKMAKACDEYNQFILHLPEIYIGKIEHLNAIVRLTCDAAKKSAEERRIHIGPWRKRRFMQMKWSASITNKKFVEDRRSTDEMLSNSSSRDEHQCGFEITSF